MATTIEQFRILFQVIENMEGLRRDMRQNAARYKADGISGRISLASVITVMRGDAAEYNRRLDWVLNATQTARISNKLDAAIAALGLVRTELIADYTAMRTVANQQASVALSDLASVNAAADSLLAFLPAHDFLW